MKKLIIFFTIIFQIIVNIKCQIPMGRAQHTATLIKTKIYFLGGLGGNGKSLNDFFFLDLSKSFETGKAVLPFTDLSVKASAIPPHHAAAASLYSDDSIFLFGGNVDPSFNNPSFVEFSFNSTQLEWNAVTVSQGDIPARESTMNAVTDNNNKVYVFGGGFNQPVPNSVPAKTAYVYSTKLNIFDTVNKIWTISESGLPGRDGHTATFLPDTNDIIYIGGYRIEDITNV
jgi:N-acetylneuraminic acid mutarotase